MSVSASPKNHSVPKHHPNKSANVANTRQPPPPPPCQLLLSCARDGGNNGVPADSEFRCKQCGTHLCRACEVTHGKAYPAHERVRLQQQQQSEILCGRCREQRKSRASVHCRTCKKYLCVKCDSAAHPSPTMDAAHQRTPVPTPILSGTNITPGTMATHQERAQMMETPLADMLSMEYNSYDQLEDGSVSKLLDVTTETVGRGAYANNRRSSGGGGINAGHPRGDYESRRDAANVVDDGNGRSFLLVNDIEVLQVKNPRDFVARLGCPDSSLVKVVSIFGNTGEGKSHTLNHTFFAGEEVFRTSQSQTSCTLGVWAAYDDQLNVVIIDTEGLLGVSANQNQRTRLLLKVLAISDIVIYRTRAERLHNDLFQFLGDASVAYKRHFDKELKVAAERCGFGGPLSQMGPSIIIFHETQYTDVLKPDNSRACSEQLKDRFYKLNYSYDAFSSLDYVGTKTLELPTDFSDLKKAVKKHLRNSSVRSQRQPSVVYHALQVLNTKFSGNIEKTVAETFPDQYFTCSGKCLSCGIRCQNSMNHHVDNIPHCASTKCKYQHQFDNRIFTCKVCHEQGKETAIIPQTSSATDSTWLGLAKYAWAGYVLECPHCGIIYRSRQYWYGNRDPVETVVRTEITHVWPGSTPMLQGSQNAAQKVLDGVTYISSTIGTLSAGPTKMVGSWMADCIAPPYWKPNSEITHCGLCEKEFKPTDTKHHCRACGDGFCEVCCDYYRPVPEKGWEERVRVCKKCHDNKNAGEGANGDTEEIPITARKVGEMIQSTLGTVVSAMDYPLGIIKDSARPSYWVRDEDIIECALCRIAFTSKLAKHHCRACGQGVCHACSPSCKSVPLRGWDQPVRVCNQCIDKNDF